jgi:2-hydroxychromene-2-carboxylate isomerase
MIMDILFIYSENCVDCKRMYDFLQLATLFKNINIVRINSETKEAIDIAVKHGIDDLPACVIGSSVFFGKDGFTYVDISNAVAQMS